ncbi:hypothetical protein BCR41DRAFT_353437, partial [Lobosporangium transversale]
MNNTDSKKKTKITEITRSTIDTITTHAVLSKAISNDTKPTPGYLFPEIARLTQSPGTSSVTLSQLLKIITPVNGDKSSLSNLGGGVGGGAVTSSSSLTYSSSPHVLLKALKILRQLAQSGSAEFRTNLARRGKGLLAEIVGYRGQWDEIHGDRFNEDIRNVAEDLIEYMHANPVQEEELVGGFSDSFTDKEAMVMRNSTQGLPGFGNPEHDDSDSEKDALRPSIPKKKSKKKDEKPMPPLPGFGNPEFENDDVNSEPTLMKRLVEKLQDMTAPPPPMAMRAAFREQEQRRQKLFVGEYSMRDETHGGIHNNPNYTSSKAKEGAVALIGTNPFKRTVRVQGMAAGGWNEISSSKDGSGIRASLLDMTASHVFPVARSGTGSVQFRNETAGLVYERAQHVQTELVRSKLQQSLLSDLLTEDKSNKSSTQDLIDTTFSVPNSTPAQQTEIDISFVFWGIAKDICDVVVAALEQEKSSSLVDQSEDLNALNATNQGTPVMTGLLRDMIDWIEHENWERRLRYLFVLDAFLAHPKIEPELMGCSSLPVLSKTLMGPMCLEAAQPSVQELSSHLAKYIKNEYRGSSRSSVSSGKIRAMSLINMTLLDISDKP